jgi:CxxC motif-containing protein (DUF1111 family)
MRRFVLPVSLAAALLSMACATDDQPIEQASDQPSDQPILVADTAAILAVAGAPGSAIPGLSARETQLFNQGMAVFATPFTQETGLGPLFNSNSCAACHDDPTLGGYGDSAEVHMAAYHPGQACSTLDAAGGPVVQQHVTDILIALGILKEPDITGATATAARTTPLIFGLGLLDAIPDAEIKLLARIRHPEGVHGRPASLLILSWTPIHWQRRMPSYDSWRHRLRYPTPPSGRGVRGCSPRSAAPAVIYRP